jgi:hypothetical protein
MPDQDQTVPATKVGVTPVKFDGSTTFQSPFFWIVIGIGIGWWIARGKKLFDEMR